MNISQKQHYVHAALFWMITGSILAFFGLKWVWLGFQLPVSLLIALTCVSVGWMKGEFAIGKAAKRAVVRIRQLPEKSHFFKLFSPGQWLLVFGMMGLGMIVRNLGVEKSYRGIVLAIVGIALFWASRYFWRAACEKS